ncbi:hypothetical protein YC2023_055397 [Brassica napus]
MGPLLVTKLQEVLRAFSSNVYTNSSSNNPGSINWEKEAQDKQGERDRVRALPESERLKGDREDKTSARQESKMPRTTRGSEQRRLQCLQDIQKLVTPDSMMKLNGVGLDDMSFTELASLGSMLDEGFRIVDEQLDNVVGAHEEITTKQVKIIILIRSYGGTGLDSKNREEDLAYQSLLAGRRVALRNKAREFRLSPPETQPWRSDDPERLVSLYAPIFSPQCPSVPRLTLIAFCLVLAEVGHRLSGDGERETIDSLEMEKERLRLFNHAHCRRMLGKELDGMSYSELFVFSFEISGAIMKVVSMKKIKRDEEMGKTKRPRPSVNVRSQSPRDRYDGGGRFSSLVTTLRDWI